ncbi:MAG: hypothetical protein JXR70_07390 [Spirochaetales bacterium]|nr:hypothetical protein [Spirochaetales bacterium]
MQHNRRILLFLLSVLLASCAPKARITLFLPEASLASYENYSPGAKNFQKLAEKRGYLSQLRLLNSDENNSFSDVFLKEQADIYFIDPFVNYPTTFWANNSENLFFTLGKTLDPTEGAHVLHLVFNDSDVYEKAGERAARLVIEKPESFADEFIPCWGSLFYQIPGYDDLAYRQFKHGFRNTIKSDLPENELFEEKITSLNDKARARDSYDKLKSQGVNCFFLHSYTLNSFFVSLLATESHYMALSDWNLDLPLNSRILITVNHNPWKAMESIFDNITHSDGHLKWKEKVLLVEPELVVSEELYH